jgi:VIT1/CCC1 family predicted Fe2+/Mn2+ transporter
VAISDVEQSLANLKLERDAIVLYDALAGIERDARRAAAFRHIASNERRHGEIWADKLRQQGVAVPVPDGPRLRVRLIIWLARLLGTRAVADLVQALEGDEGEAYEGQPSPEVESIAADERRHAEIWRELEGGARPPTVGTEPAAVGAKTAAVGIETADIGAKPAADVKAKPAADGAGTHEGVPASVVEAMREGTSRKGVRASAADRSPADISARERWHRAGQTGTLRATIFGVNDGLVSNLALVMGVAGAAPDQHIVLLAGIAGLLAGAFSMAAGEWVSMQSQRELFERQIALERAELAAIPEEEEIELTMIYRRKGFSEDESAAIARRLMSDPQTALDTLVREELGLDPEQLGSPWGAAGGSFLAFAAGAALPVVPYLLLRESSAFWIALVLSLAALFVVGAAVSLLTGRSALFSGVRQSLIGGAAAAVTYGVGALVGVSVGG